MVAAAGVGTGYVLVGMWIPAPLLLGYWERERELKFMFFLMFCCEVFVFVIFFLFCLIGCSSLVILDVGGAEDFFFFLSV